ncbi:zinc finger protein 804A isoform X1 [Corvus cornix cornix]|uniref:zinc finger protein 804A isoform X1 n=1 Tax=Corvus cornix cornix TaxID=932674 RepID=UPI000534B581|nr:zinc finger protein 804A isoform X1 [Corvus cornix cornix]
MIDEELLSKAARNFHTFVLPTSFMGSPTVFLENFHRSEDYAEKKNTIAKALEDLKANFYCELCDKQYYKHQEFDNHINSYDHAHKQRLKELKQREFARNVASKSRKDERKQEKALQRLHKLAELRKERTCAPGSGPMFKSTTVTVQDDCNDSPKSAAIDSTKSQNFSCTLMHDAQNCKDVASVVSSSPGDAGSPQSDTNKCGDQVQGAQGHRVGFSFAFPKKAAVKLESSAAVFYEFNDETSMEHGFSRRSRFVPETCNLQSPSAAEIVVCPEEKHNCFHPLVEKCTDTAEAPESQESKEPSSEESGVLESPALTPAMSHSKHPVSLDTDSHSVDVSAADLGHQTLPLAADSAQVLPLDGSGHELQASRAPVQELVEDCSSLQDVAEENYNDGNSDPSANETEIKNLGADAVVPAPSEEGSGAPKSKPDMYKRPCQPFVPVLSKYGSNILQWPSEMLIYTSTDPSISYSCNPLYFDFKSSRASDSQEKPKHQPNIPHLNHKTESHHVLVSDFTNKPTSECGGYEVEVKKNVCNYTIPLLSDVSLFRNCDLAKNQNKVSLDESFTIRKIEKYHMSQNPLQQNTVIDEKYNKVWIKEGHEKWLHRGRKSKRRRKLCHCHYHHCGDTTVPEMEMSPVTEKEVTYRDENKYQHLQNNSEKCRHDAGNIWLTASEVLQSHRKFGIENGPKRVMSASDHIHWDRGWCDFWSAKNSGQHHGCKGPHRKSKASSRRQAKQLTTSSRRHSLRHSKTCCSWKGRRSSYNPEHKCLGQCSEEKGLSQNQPIKRGYSVLTEEPEKPHRKRRQHTYSSSSDESSCGQTLSAEECLRQVHALGTYHKAKGKHRRRKTRIHHVFLDRNAKSETSEPSKENSANSTLNILGDLLTQDDLEETNADPKDDDAKDRDETMELEESKAPLETAGPQVLEDDKLMACAVMESAPAMLPDVITSSAASAPDHTAPAAAAKQDLPQEAKKKENVNSRENQARYKIPVPNRHLEHAPPKSYLCHYELAESLPHEKMGEVAGEWVQCNPGIFSSPPPLPFKEAQVNSHTFLTTEQLIAPFPLPDQTLIFPPDNHEKFKELPSEAYQQIVPQNVLSSKVKFAFAPPAMQPPGSPLPPLPLQPPLCSTSVTTIHHTILQQHAAAGALKVLQPHQQFLSQVPALSRAPLPHLPVGPRLCPGGHAAFVAPPHLPLLPPSVLHPVPLAFPPLPHTVFPSLLAPHPAVIPLQPLF